MMMAALSISVGASGRGSIGQRIGLLKQSGNAPWVRIASSVRYLWGDPTFLFYAFPAYSLGGQTQRFLYAPRRQYRTLEAMRTQAAFPDCLTGFIGRLTSAHAGSDLSDFILSERRITLFIIRDKQCRLALIKSHPAPAHCSGKARQCVVTSALRNCGAYHRVPVCARFLRLTQSLRSVSSRKRLLLLPELGGKLVLQGFFLSVILP
jgi:hypothetical protein